jgi:Tfp pilus assembly protein PilF
LGDRNQVAVQLNSLGIVYLAQVNLGAARSYLEDSIAIAREIDSDARLATALSNLGIVEISADNMGRAVTVLREALVLDQDQGDTWGAAIVQTSLAAATVLTGLADEAHQRAARIAGAAAEIRDRAGIPMSEPDAALLTHLLAPGRPPATPRPGTLGSSQAEHSPKIRLWPWRWNRSVCRPPEAGIRASTSG